MDRGGGVRTFWTREVVGMMDEQENLGLFRPNVVGHLVSITAYVVVELKDYQAYAVTKEQTEADVRRLVADGSVPIRWQEPQNNNCAQE